MLDVSQLSRHYGDFVAVDKVSFRIEPGEIVGLLGHNGAGKTTIMKMLSGYLEPSTGSVRMGQFSLAENPKAIQAQLGYLPENLPVYPEMSVADYLDYAAELKGLRGNHKFEEIRRVVRATELTEKLLAAINTLSRGYRQRVGVAQALLGRPKLVILDEPTNGLDPTQTEHMRALIRELAQQATVILSTHIMQEVEALCERVLILSQGQLKVDEQLDSLRHSNHLLVSTSATMNDLNIASNDIAGIEHIETLNPTGIQQRFRLRLHSEADLTPVSAELSRKLINAGADLYQLQAEHRDLETLFREVSQAASGSESVKQNQVQQQKEAQSNAA